MFRFKTLLLLSLVLFISTPAWSADAVIRKSSKDQVTGKITKADKNEIEIKTRKGDVVKIPVNDIKEISWDNDPKALERGLYQEGRGKWDEAAELFKQALSEIPISNKLLRAEVGYYAMRLEGNKALNDPTTRKAAITKLTKFNDGPNANFYRYYDGVFLLGRLLMADENFAEAKKVYSKLEAAPFDDMKMASQTAQAKIAFLQKDYDKAMSRYQKVIDMPMNSEATKIQHWEAMLGKAQCLELKKQFDESLKLLDTVIANLDASQARILSETYLQKGNCLVQKKNNPQAIIAYLMVDIIFPKEQAHAEALYNLTKLWPALNHPQRATKASETLKKKYPNSPWTKKLSS